MTLRSAKWFFIIGTAFSAVLFLVLTVDTHLQVGALTHADKLTDQVVAGKWVFEKHNCNDCHTILGFGGYYAPDLTRAYYRLGEANLENVISKPDIVLANSWRKMPNQHLSEQELTELTAFLKWVADIENNGWPPQDNQYLPSAEARGLVAAATMSPGAALFKTKGCMGCHAIGGSGGNIGPPLDHVGTKMSRSEIETFVRNPQAVRPQSPMPPQPGLRPQELKLIAEFLAKNK